MASMSSNSSWSPFSFKNVSTPLNINDKLVNITNSNDPKNFGSTETNRQWGASGVSNNATAAARSALKGGRKSFRRKIKNIVVNYKMKGKKMTLHSIKQKLKSILTFGKSRNRRSVNRRSKNTRRKRGQRGGTYQQYMGGIPSNASYSTGGVLPQYLSALAHPSPFTRTGGNCVDNYNYNTNKGFNS